MKTIWLITILVFGCISVVFADECCDKWTQGKKDDRYQAWTNAGMRQQHDIAYCPECGEKLRVVYGYYVAAYCCRNGIVSCSNEFFKHWKEAQAFIDSGGSNIDYMFADIIYEEE